MKAIVDEGQNMMDIALQYLGDWTGVVDLANANGISTTELLVPGQELIIPAVINAGAVKYFADKGIVIATQEELQVARRRTGINYMKIGFDFIVS